MRKTLSGGKAFGLMEHAYRKTLAGFTNKPKGDHVCTSGLFT